MQNLPIIPLDIAEFSRILEGKGTNPIVLGMAENAIYYWKVSEVNGEIQILLRHPEYYLKPAAWQFANGTIGIGLLNSFFLIAADKHTFEFALPYHFYDVIYANAGKIVIQHEIGFACINYAGQTLWEWVGDLVESWKIQNGVLSFKTFEGADIIQEI
ncbi:hypothetical protein [Gloeobacter morelensis]|uniref:Uncharacterized protein n=1 Tax=Gloeobacter morelensis MG652769 TaxID=2781736 RepID=A0ABY3PKL6_9CYAN|nr:hypothetical protein [Gloeobacter morelensis]UFP94215.1 hypothetical protein ISF26_21045 [Gloeobacter morelensis MG652769]